MLLIGSRAIRFHIPEFREPRDWDLIATTSEIEALKERLEPERRRYSKGYVPTKTHFRLEGCLVEVEDANKTSYWGEVLRTFSHCESVEVPVFGRVIVPPLAYLLLTKHCGLVYSIVHWHKNLEDLYWLRGFLEDVPPEVGKIAPLAIADAANKYAKQHARRRHQIAPCHPSCGAQQRQNHGAYHSLMRLGDTPLCHSEGAWEGFPSAKPEERTSLLVRLLAEEAMVLAAEMLNEPDREGRLRSPDEILRRVLRCLATGPLPAGMRYFVVNHYHEIMGAVRADWVQLAASVPPASTIVGTCSSGDLACSATTTARTAQVLVASAPCSKF